MNGKNKELVRYLELLLEGISTANQKHILEIAERSYVRWNGDESLQMLKILASEQQRIRDKMELALQESRQTSK